MTHGSLYKFSNIKEKSHFYGTEMWQLETMLSYPALKNLRDRLAASAATVLRSEDKKVVDLINRLEDQMTSLKENYDHYCEIENKMINYYYDDLQKYFVKAAGKFSINTIKDNLKAYDEAYKDCEKFKNLFGDLCIEAGRCNIVDSDNNDLTNDKEAHKKYANWYEKIEIFQKEIYEEIQDQVNEQMSTFRSTIELVETKLQAIEDEENKEW